MPQLPCAPSDSEHEFYWAQNHFSSLRARCLAFRASLPHLARGLRMCLLCQGRVGIGPSSGLQGKLSPSAGQEGHATSCGNQPQRALRGQGGEAGGVGRSGSGPALPLTSRVAVGELFHPPASAHSSGKGGLAPKFSDLGKPTQRVAEGKIHITARNCNQRSTTAFSRVEQSEKDK